MSAPARDTWFLDYREIVWFVEYLAEVGWTGREIAHVVAKPRSYTTEYLAARASAPLETEPGL